MYGKVFRQMYDSTVATNWKALVTFQQFIILADSDGVVDMTPEAISRYTNIPLDIIQAGIIELEKPDPKSRSKEAEGRRLQRLDPDREWGWYLVNYEYYANLRTREEIRAGNRERKRRQREKGRHGESHDVTHVTPGHEKSRYIDREGDTDREGEEKGNTSPGGDQRPVPSCPHEDIIRLYHTALPTLPKVRLWTEPRKKLLQARWREEADRQTLAWWKQFFEYIAKSDFLCGRSEPSPGRPVFMADLEWIVRPTNFTKIFEGKYENRGTA